MCDDKTFIPEVPPKNLLELRAFNENEELLLVHLPDGTYRGRIRTDFVGEDVLCLDEEHKIWGDSNKNQISNDTTILKEERGIEVSLPFEVEQGQTEFVAVRNYYNEVEADIQAIDWRFISFMKENASPYLSEEGD